MIFDKIIIFLYLVFLLVVGIANRKGSKNFKDFAKVNLPNRLANILIVATLFSSAVGAGTTFGLTERAYFIDISYTFAIIFISSIDFIYAKYVVPRLVKHHYLAESTGDIMFKYYGTVGRVVAGFSGIIVSIGFLAAQITVSAALFKYFFSIDYVISIILSYGIVIIYTTVGGMQSIVFTNFIQFIAMIVAVPVITIFGIYHIGGLSDFATLVPMEKLYPTSDNGFMLNLIIAMLGLVSTNFYPTSLQRMLIEKDFTKTVTAIYRTIVINWLFLIFVTINGLIAYILLPNLDLSSKTILPSLIHEIIPYGLQGFVIIGLISALMSTADSDLNISSINLVKDIINVLFKIENQQKLVKIAKVLNVLIGSISILIALKFNDVIDLIIFFTGFWGPTMLVPLVFGAFGILLPKKGYIISVSISLLSFIIWESYFSYLRIPGVFIGTLSNLIIFSTYIINKKIIINHRFREY